MDYDKLSTEELIALQKGEYDKLSTETLQSLRQTEIERSASTIDKMHPDISFADRAIVKNFASNPESSLAYLQQQHPDMIFKNVDGEILARGKNESSYKVLDPSGLDWQDATDVVTDVGQGFFDGASKLLGATVGGAFGGPIGAMAGGAGLSAASGAATEYAKQGMGSALGIPNNTNHTNAVISSAANVVMPVLGSQIGKAYNYTKGTIAPNIASFLSGINKGVVKNIHIDEKARETIRGMGKSAYLKDKSKEIGSNVNDEFDLRGRLLNAVDAQQINVSSVRDNISSSLQGRTSNLLPDEVKDASRLMSKFDGLPETGDLFLSPDQVRRLRNNVHTVASNPETMDGTTKLAKTSRESLKDALSDQAPDPKAHRLASDNYHEIADELDENAILRSFMNKKGTNNEAANLQSLIDKNYAEYGLDQATAQLKADQAMEFLGKYGGVDPKKIAREVTSANVFNEPKKMPQGWIGKAAGGSIGSGIGAGLGYLSGGGLAAGIPLTIGGGIAGEIASSPWAIKGYANAAKGTENLVNGGVSSLNGLSPYILRSTPKSMYNILDGREN